MSIILALYVDILSAGVLDVISARDPIRRSYLSMSGHGEFWSGMAEMDCRSSSSPEVSNRSCEPTCSFCDMFVDQKSVGASRMILSISCLITCSFLSWMT